MTEPYLIHHKVRGESAFDIAIQHEIDGEVTWIVSTSGHRAYPYQWWELEPPKIVMAIPDDWPDHYSCNDRKAKAKPSNGLGLLEQLGMVKPMTRRI